MIKIPLNKISNGHIEISAESINLMKNLVIANLMTNKEITDVKEEH